MDVHPMNRDSTPAGTHMRYRWRQEGQNCSYAPLISPTSVGTSEQGSQQH